MIQFSTMDVRYELRVSRKAKNVSLRITKKGNVILTRPRFVPEGIALRFFERKKSWVLKHLLLLQDQKTRSPQMTWIDGARIPFLNEQLTLVVKKERRKADVVRQGTSLSISADPSDRKEIHRLLERWYRMQAERYFHEQCRQICHRLETAFRNITIKGHTSRWGSCSKARNLNFNWKLMMAPEEVAFSVAVHECCHLIHLNHSRSFWNLVFSLFPRYEEANTWLRKHGGSIM